MAADKTKWQPPKQVEKQDAVIIEEIGKKLERLRLKQGLSIYAFTKDLGVSRTAYNQMERGEIYFNFRNLLVILSRHNLDLRTFILTDIEDL